MRIIFIISFCLSFLSAQDYLDALIQDVLHGSRDSAAIYLPTMEQRYPNNPSLMYLKGLLETNGEEAKTIFAKLYNTHPTSDYGDDAVMKVAEYYYAEGLYAVSYTLLTLPSLFLFFFFFFSFSFFSLLSLFFPFFTLYKGGCAI